MTDPQLGYIHEAKYDLDGVCDREFVVWNIAGSIFILSSAVSEEIHFVLYPYTIALISIFSMIQL